MKKSFLCAIFFSFSFCVFSQSSCHELTKSGMKTLGGKIGKYAGNGSSAGYVLGEYIGEVAGIRISEWVCNTGTSTLLQAEIKHDEIMLPQSDSWFNSGKKYIYEKSITLMHLSES